MNCSIQPDGGARAGEGTRMRSSLPKVCIRSGQSLLAHVLDAAPHGAGACWRRSRAGTTRRSPMRFCAPPRGRNLIQRERLGTAHAVLAAREGRWRAAPTDLLVVFGDTPLDFGGDVRAVAGRRWEKGAALAVLGSAPPIRPATAAVDEVEHLGRDPRASRCHRNRAQDHAVHAGGDGVRWSQGAGDPRSDQACQQQAEYYLVDAVTIVREMDLEAVVIEYQRG